MLRASIGSTPVATQGGGGGPGKPPLAAKTTWVWSSKSPSTRTPVLPNAHVLKHLLIHVDTCCSSFQRSSEIRPEALPTNRPNGMSSFCAAILPAVLAYNRPHPISVQGRPMKIAVIHDYADVFRTTRAYQRLTGHDVVVHTDAYTDPARVVEQVAGC